MENKNLDHIKIMEYYDEKKKYNMNIFTYMTNEITNDMKIIFVMSGCLRDALNYLKKWMDYADKNNYIIIAPEFDKRHYSIGDHEYGNVIDVEYDYSSQDIYVPFMKYDTKINSEEDWIYRNIDEIYLDFIHRYNIEKKGYIMFGHSSGSQFTHRYAMLGNSKYCNKYICANAGLYTFFNTNKNYPYGIKNLDKYLDRIKASLQKDVYILAGEKDTELNMLNLLPEDNAEGKDRYERAKNFYNSAKEFANNNGVNFNWKFISMPNVGHHSKDVIPIAVNIINEKYNEI